MEYEVLLVRKLLDNLLGDVPLDYLPSDEMVEQTVVEIVHIMSNDNILIKCDFD
jgi:hypothetical protein